MFTAVALALALIPTQVGAQEVLDGRVDTVVLATGATLANVAGLFPAVGTTMGVGSELPNPRWAIAGTVTGGAQLTFGALSIASGLTGRSDPWVAAYGVATALLGGWNLVLGVINLLQSHRALRRMQILDGPRGGVWSVAPVDLGAGGVGVGLAFRE